MVESHGLFGPREQHRKCFFGGILELGIAWARLDSDPSAPPLPTPVASLLRIRRFIGRNQRHFNLMKGGLINVPVSSITAITRHGTTEKSPVRANRME